MSAITRAWNAILRTSRGGARSVGAGALSLALLASFAAFGACKETGFMGKTLNKPVPEKPPVHVVPTPVYLQLNVVSLRPEAWWKSCLYVSVNGNDDQAVALGCNKDPGVKGRQVAVPVNPKSCNSLRFFVNIHQNTIKCERGKPCPTSEQPTCQRVNIRPRDSKFFVILDALQLGALDRRVDVRDREIANANKQVFAEAQKNATTMKYIRMFFEDQSDDALAKYEADIGSKDAATRLAAGEKYGVDFNDYIFDVVAKDVAVTVEGTNIPCALPQSEPIKPYVPKSSEGCSVNNLATVAAKPTAVPVASAAPASPTATGTAGAPAAPGTAK